MTLVGRLRYAEHRSIPEIDRELIRRAIIVAQHTVTNLFDRYDELRALATADPERLEPLLPQGRVILAIDGLQLESAMKSSGYFATASPARTSGQESLVVHGHGLGGPDHQVRRALPVPITGVVSGGEESIEGRGQGPARHPASALSFPLPARGGQADLRGGSTPRRN